MTIAVVNINNIKEEYLMGNGLDNAHNNAFGNGKNPGIGGVSGVGGTINNGSGGSSKPGPSGFFNGWCLTPGPDVPISYDPNGYPRITITRGVDPCRINVDLGSSAYSNAAGISTLGRFKPAGTWDPKPGDWNVIENGKAYVGNDDYDNYVVRVNTLLYGMTTNKGALHNNPWLINPGDNENGKVSYYKSFEFYRPEAEKTLTDYLDVKDAIYSTSLFYKETSNKFGDAFAKQAEALAEGAKGKKIRNAAEGIAAFNRYKDVLNKKFSVADREAVARALESMNKDQMAKNLKTFGKAFGLVGTVIDIGDMTTAMVKGLRTGDWGDAFRTGERLATSKLASAAVAFAYAALATTPLGIVGYALIMAVTSALIDDALMKRINDFVMSL
jgi:hypothetical protein